MSEVEVSPTYISSAARSGAEREVLRQRGSITSTPKADEVILADLQAATLPRGKAVREIAKAIGALNILIRTRNYEPLQSGRLSETRISPSPVSD